jgi:hypothetical protein
VDVNELIRKAWEAVEKAGIPEALQPEAFKEAVAYLRRTEDGDVKSGGDARSSGGSTRSSGRGKKRPAAPKVNGDAGGGDIPDENEFFAGLANESGVEESRLRDLLQLTSTGSVHVTPPIREVGTSVKQQAQRLSP